MEACEDVCMQPDTQAVAQTPPMAVTGIQEKRPIEKTFSALQRRCRR
jgi:hypothetical protein